MTEYIQLVSLDKVSKLDEPFGLGYPVVFDKIIKTKGYSEVRVWVHVFVHNYKTTPVTPSAKLTVRFMHQFTKGSFDYAEGTITSKVTSYINGYVAKPVVGEELRILCGATGLPPGPYDIWVTCYLVP